MALGRVIFPTSKRGGLLRSPEHGWIRVYFPCCTTVYFPYRGTRILNDDKSYIDLTSDLDFINANVPTEYIVEYDENEQQ